MTFAETVTGDAALWLVLWVFAVGAVTSIIYEVAALFTGLPTISTIIRAAIDHFAVTRRAAARGDERRAARQVRHAGGCDLGSGEGPPA